jgi:hypothetical protein
MTTADLLNVLGIYCPDMRLRWNEAVHTPDGLAAILCDNLDDDLERIWRGEATALRTHISVAIPLAPHTVEQARLYAPALATAQQTNNRVLARFEIEDAAHLRRES